MTLVLKDAFGLTAREYDRARQQLVPCFDDFYRTAVELLPFPREQAITVLDLGAGTGLLAGFIANAFPTAQLTLLDIAPEMLARARERFADHTDRVRFTIADLDALQIEGSYDAIVSALAIHHLEDEGKRRLFKTIHAALKPGGVFVDAEQVLGPTAAAEARYRANWLKRVRELGVSEDDLAAALERMKLDRSATVEAQLAWLRDAGFADVDCAYKDGMFAVIGAPKLQLEEARAKLSDASCVCSHTAAALIQAAEAVASLPPTFKANRHDRRGELVRREPEGGLPCQNIV